ncbi:hypothetical protein [Sporosarcina sp. P29]|uniref:hypothetical protein n=1 Tax=Sporosarcina sp. P29 TaxID=2048252 RepID=UPI000C16998F|nr:hypothetical protein [Sporosarcina sp. P29]PID00802.1 hypothetical protein CSV68_00850 [Sporosarcina sp. P29]
MEKKTKKPFYKRWWFIGFFTIVALGFVMDLFESEESKQAKLDEEISIQQEREEKNEERAKSQETRKQEVALELEKQQNDEIKEKERLANRSIDQKLAEDIEDIDTATLSEDGILTLEQEAKNYWDETAILEQNVYSLFEAAGEGFSDPSVNVVKMVITTGMVDNKGNESLEDIVKFNYTKNSFEELNLKKFLEISYSQTWRILNESDTYWIHPGIYKNVKADYTKNLQYGLTKQ